MNQEDTSQAMPIFISIIPNLIGGEGHIIPYHLSVSKAASLLGWQHVAAVPPDPKTLDLPANWYSCLSQENLEIEISPLMRILKFKDVWKLGLTIANYLRQEIEGSSKYSIVFIERFIHLQLLALLIALYLIPKKKLSVWILYRRDIHKSKTRWIYKLLNKAIKKILTPGKFHLLTDSEILSNSLSNYFKETVTVVPIPHTDFISMETIYKSNNEIICWWAGAPRIEKGWNIMKSFVNLVSKEASQICVIAAQSSELTPTLGGVQVKFIPNNLTDLEYLEWLKACDIILLPYDSNAYSERTSGIFTECIMAGKIPVVSEGTWMAKELSKYGIEELIIDWSQPEIIVNKIIKLSNSLTLRDKIKQIQKAYQNFHTIESYALQMKNLFDASYNS